MPAAIPVRYARALVELAMRPGAGDPREALGQLDGFVAALNASPALRQVLLSPAVPPPQKRRLVEKLGGSLGLSSLVRRFLLVVIGHRRSSLLREIRDAAEALMDERAGLVRVDITSARELSEAQRDALSERLSRLTGRQARPQFAVDPALIGGVTARVGSTIYDGSVRGQLEALQKRLGGAEG